MTAEHVRQAMVSHRPFEIQMADGEVYPVAHPDFIAFSRNRTAVLLVLEDDRVQVLPLLTMTGISYSPETNRAD
jgi:hypothetical protein